MDLRLLDSFARAHHGLVTREVARGLGISTSSWYRALASGRLEAIHPNVARLYGSPATTEQRIAAAVLAAARGASASHRTAAWLWGIPGDPPAPVDVMLQRRTRDLHLVGVAIHRPRDHRDLVPVLRQGIPTTNILRTLCDLGAHDPAAVPGAVGHVVTTKLARVDTLHRAVIVHSRRGRAGVPALREALQEWDIAGKAADSVLEPAMSRLVARHGLPPVQFHVPIGRYTVDFVVVGSCVVIECDGWGPHVLDRANWERDRARDAELAALGFVVLRVTYRDITRRGEQTARRIRAALARWAPDLVG
jgi:very-short-patch-repair endonuclease